MSQTTGMTMARRWGAARVSGDSMLPTLRAGDLLLVRHRPASVSSGQLVVARFPDGTVAIKRALEPRRTSGGADGWWLLSDNPEHGVDSRHRGPIPATSVLAVAVARIWPRPGLLG